MVILCFRTIGVGSCNNLICFEHYYQNSIYSDSFHREHKEENSWLYLDDLNSLQDYMGEEWKNRCYLNTGTADSAGVKLSNWCKFVALNIQCFVVGLLVGPNFAYLFW